MGKNEKKKRDFINITTNDILNVAKLMIMQLLKNDEITPSDAAKMLGGILMLFDVLQKTDDMPSLLKEAEEFSEDFKKFIKENIEEGEADSTLS